MIHDHREGVGDSREVSVSEIEAARIRLRQRWELASVLNFFKVFEPVVETNLKISAEEVEMALIVPNKSLAQLHLVLLKGIPPVSKNLKDSDAWVVAVFKKLTMWWPWVAEGNFPLTTAKGAEVASYNKLDPTVRLTILKALCEIRADQHDVVSCINDSVKRGIEVSSFQKSKIGGDGKGTSYWCDGNESIGLRLYKEVNSFPRNGVLPAITCQWETLATNLEEFQKVVDEFSCSKSKVEVAVAKAVEADAIPVLIKLQKKKQRALKQRQREEKLINGFCRSITTRSCRNRRPISYTFDEYDKAIDEAIRETKKRKTRECQGSEKNGKVPQEDPEQENQHIDGESTVSDTESDEHEAEDISEDSSEESGGEQHDSEIDDKENMNHGNKSRSTLKSQKQAGSLAENTKRSKKITANAGHSAPHIRNLGAKNRVRQRPTRNTALESAVVPDSEDDISSDSSDS